MKNIQNLLGFYCFFLIPVIVAFLFECLLKTFHLSILYNFIENVLFALAVLLFSFLVNSLRCNFIFTISILLFNLCLLFETFYYYLFDNYLNPSALFVVFESNLNEIKNFVIAHVDVYMLIFFLLIAAICVFSIIKIKKKLNKKPIVLFDKFLVFELLFFLFLFIKVSKLILYNVPYLMLKTPFSYYQEMKKFEIYGKENKIGEFANVKHEIKEKELYVIILGESTSRKHFNLYNNYYRETTPFLNSIKDDLFVFNDVISPHSYTIGSLSKALTLGNYEDPEGKYKGSILQLFNQAGFSTYWISNQRPVGIMDTHITKIGLGADKSFFFNTKHTDENTVYDDKLVEKMYEIIKEKEKKDKKVIFIHMLGTHMRYENRFPAMNNYFKDLPITEFKTDKAYKTINAYDNAVRYNDKLLKEIIDIVKDENQISYVLYFSDHGQEVFDDINFFGHTIDERITKNMYEIPMFLWLSDSYKSNVFFELNINNRYMTDDMFHSIADISNISSDQVDTTRSVFNESFKERKRIIKDTIDFDSYFK